MNKFSRLLTLLVLLSPLQVMSEDTQNQSENSNHAEQPQFGGPDSPQGQFEEAHRPKSPAFRFPILDSAFSDWKPFKAKLDDEYGLKFGGHYSTMYQTNGDDNGWGGNFRLNLQWTVIGKDTATPGYFSLLVDNRHALGRNGAPGTFGKFGQYGVTATQFGDFDGNFKIITMAWNQRIDKDTGYIIGSYDPNDYLSVQGYVNPQTTFSNVNILLETSQALPDTAWGIAAGHWFNDSVYVQGGVTDANGYGGDGNVFFEGGAEFFKWVHLGWSPTKGDRYYKNLHIAAWHTDEREDYGQEAVWGVSSAINWTFNDVFMPFAKVGFSEGDHDFFNNTATFGILYKVMSRSDFIGIATNYGRFANGHKNGLGGESQISSELFYNFQVSQHFAVTPSIQYIDNPLMSDVPENAETIFGVRARVDF
ncbi:hypothetical protein VSU01S_28110 [Vibrio superstes NBRC 103154]|uniref:Uncharacterized protein n=2 Tax=Vibrio superstes TaxID=198815 RepID=A0A511QUV5_9VIBR|nr:carbohydrate porin [Vibrio superstes]GEM80566.1 hypothetical protein VSU01S_28110 [Vibrio superstes NBRC 103154]